MASLIILEVSLMHILSSSRCDVFCHSFTDDHSGQRQECGKRGLDCSTTGQFCFCIFSLKAK